MSKAGCARMECEDSIGIDRRKMKFCVADGATEAFDSRRWARLLTKSWIRSASPVTTREDFSEWLPAAGGRLESQWGRRQLAWYAEEKSRGGAFAAFAALMFEICEGELHWSASALGDACVVRRRESGSVEDMIPDLSEAGFERRPTLLPSKHGLQTRALGEMEFRAGTAGLGDVFLLMTDAIAAWYLKMRAADPARAEDFEASLVREEGLTDLLEEERRRSALRNDDLAVIRIAYSGADHRTNAENR